jgi:hypothetical protein
MQKSLVQSLVSQLQTERTRLETELRRVSAALTAFGNVYIHGRTAKSSSPVRRKHKISAAGRRRIAAAQRARWAKAKSGAKKRK